MIPTVPLCCAISCSSKRWVHFVGVGGSGLSALALLALKQGWEVSGSDAAWNDRLNSLKSEGAILFSGHSGAHIKNSEGRTPNVVVVTSAVRGENEEVSAACNLGIPVLKRAEWLATITKDYDVIAVAGSHGKSTTTAMVAVALQRMGEDVTAIVGADVQQFTGGVNAVFGSSRHFVLEADEYDGCFLGISPSIAVITNVEWEHVDMFPDEDSVKEMFKLFVKNIKPGGCLVIYGDSAVTRSILSTFEKERCVKGVTYGLNQGNDWRATKIVPNAEGGVDYVAVHKDKPMAEVSLKIPGTHNVLNSLAALATIVLLACEREGAGDVKTKAQVGSEALGQFSGIRRRFEFVGRVMNCEIYDDYAHHPTEVRAVIEAAQQRFVHQPIWVVFQPHTYSRLALLLEDFAAALSGAERVIVTEVYSVREENVWKMSGSDLVSVMNEHPAAEEAMFIPTLDEVVAKISDELVKKKRENIILLTLGAGDVTAVGPKLVDALS